MKIPTKVNLGGTVYSVKFKSELKNPMNNQPCWGYCDFPHRQIMISKDIVGTCVEQTFLHEVVHAIHETWGVEMEDEMCEKYTDAMASGFHAFIAQNKGVFK